MTGTTDAVSGASASALSLTVSAVLSVSALLLVALGTGAAAGGVARANALAVAEGSLDTTVLAGDASVFGIAASNLSATGLLVSGAALLAIPTLIGIALIGISVGVAAASIVEALGPVETLTRIAPYVVFEASGVLIAATAGLLPLVHACVARLRTARPMLSGYTTGLRGSLRLTAIAAVLIVAGALIESFVVAQGA